MAKDYTEEIDIKQTFKNYEEERLYRKQRLAASFRILARRGLNLGVAGHITVRDPEFTDHFWVNTFMTSFSQIKVSDLILVNHEGRIVEGKKPINRAAFAIHSQIHQARPDAAAAAHSHSPYGKVWSTTGRLLDPITQDSCAFYNDHGLFNDFTGVVYELEEGKRIAEALGNYKAVILQNHGLLTVGQTVEEAVWWFVSMEEACKTQIMAEQIGSPILIEKEHAELTAKQIGLPVAGKGNFQPLYDEVLREEPDFLG
ncbi:class II aldolase/adducin family protein [Bacillus thermotolerans]|uniref:class II aldolase/adducin family protein n=1 Tax=Bacillus thermotolerans TaxID=1221996 RepID=UPI00058386D5|nr:class II aldolase/adducin family protein [Bacillus thermotolerans]KKB34016.1 Ribulose-5-phosphate 4-epimerase [Bacillus thermotolerans]